METNKIFGVERDVVLTALYQYKTNLILSTKENNPKIIPVNSYGIPAQNLIFIPKNIFLATLPFFEENSEITLCFFYQGRGIFFKAIPKSTVNGYGIIIPQTLYKQQEKQENKLNKTTAKLFYTSKEEKGGFLNCVSKESYPLFTPFLWHFFSEAELSNSQIFLEKIARLKLCNKNDNLEKIFNHQNKILYLPEKKLPQKNYFPYEATFTLQDDIFEDTLFLENEVYIPFLDELNNNKNVHSVYSIIQDTVTISPLDIEDTISSLPICKFLSKIENKIDSIQGRFSPLQILYLTDGMLTLGLEEGDFPLQKGSEYPISLFIDLPVGKREIFVTVYVSRLYCSKDFTKSTNLPNRTVAVCRFTSIKEEDRRFLFEKLYNTLYA